MYHIITDEYKLDWLIRILYPLQNFPDFVSRIQAQIAFNCPDLAPPNAKHFSPNNQPQKYKDFGNQRFFYGFFPFFFTWYTTLWSTSWCTNGEKAYFCNVIPSRIAS